MRGLALRIFGFKNGRSRLCREEAAEIPPITPNDMYAGNGTNAMLFFCRFSKGTGAFPDMGVEYGVFGNASGLPNALQYGSAFNDDEDTYPSANANYYSVESFPSSWEWSRDSRFPNIIDGSQNTTLYFARVTQDSRPVARCASTPSWGTDYVEATFSDNGSYARGGRTLVSYSWRFSDGSYASGSGPHERGFGVGSHYGALTVTDNYGASATAYCSVYVDSSGSCTSMQAGDAQPQRVPECPM